MRASELLEKKFFTHKHSKILKKIYKKFPQLLSIADPYPIVNKQWNVLLNTTFDITVQCLWASSDLYLQYTV